jgi:acyl-CoA hydrolase
LVVSGNVVRIEASATKTGETEMTIVLNIKTDNFDQDNTFTFAFPGSRGQERVRTGYVADFEDEGMYIMQRSACLKAQYTDKDYEETARLNAMNPIRTGDIVEVNGKQYSVKILGDYSDAGRLILV